MAITLARNEAVSATALVAALTAATLLPAAAAARGRAGMYHPDCLHRSDTSPGTGDSAPWRSHRPPPTAARACSSG
ncbi:hypothetical protein [Streptomyces wuyuanensis]|uniref:hypothetical protein n=1 Tax=Streptomyces wuyuanensis TaxID=1196353 RepID=UPI003D75CBF6